MRSNFVVRNAYPQSFWQSSYWQLVEERSEVCMGEQYAHSAYFNSGKLVCVPRVNNAS